MGKTELVGLLEAPFLLLFPVEGPGAAPAIHISTTFFYIIYHIWLIGFKFEINYCNLPGDMELPANPPSLAVGLPTGSPTAVYNIINYLIKQFNPIEIYVRHLCNKLKLRNQIWLVTFIKFLNHLSFFFEKKK